jgi:hypothetical protein
MMPDEVAYKKIFDETDDPFVRWAVVDAYLLARFLEKWERFKQIMISKIWSER